MTTKPLVGSQAQRQPQRPLNSNIISRPSPHRSQPSTSPTRRHNDGLIDLTVDVPDSTPARYGAISRTGGSRLKQELSHDSRASSQPESSNAGSLSFTSSKPAPPLRGRPRLHSDVPHARSPGMGITIDQTQNYTSTKPMPLPVRPGRQTPFHLEKSSPTTNNNKKDVRPKPYVLEIPAVAPSYAPNGMVKTVSRGGLTLLTSTNRSCRLFPMAW